MVALFFGSILAAKACALADNVETASRQAVGWGDLCGGEERRAFGARTSCQKLFVRERSEHSEFLIEHASWPSANRHSVSP
jgi:hypothetical protein